MSKKMPPILEELIRKNQLQVGLSHLAAYEISDEQPSAYPSVHIAPDAAPILSQLRDMRKITDFDKSRLFCRQAHFMEAATDSFEREVPFQCYDPTYADMSTPQLRCYFTWRTKVRGGTVLKTSLSYVFVYLYELINGVGVRDAVDAMEKMAFLWKNYREYTARLDQYLPRWIKTVYIVSGCTDSFQDLAERLHLTAAYPGAFLNLQVSFAERLLRISKYRPEKSTFFAEKPANWVPCCFRAVIEQLLPLFKEYGLTPQLLLEKPAWERNFWRPFEDAVYAPPEMILARKAVIGKAEIYHCQNGRWTRALPMVSYDRSLPSFVGYVVKRMEANLRRLTKFRGKLTPNIETVLSDASYSTLQTISILVKDADFDALIDEATVGFYERFLRSGEPFSDAACQDFTIPRAQNLKKQVEQEPYSLFAKMRGVPKESEAARFCKQAALLNDLQDDFPTPAALDVLLPTFQMMTNPQLRTYFTWRTQVRKGVYPAIDSGYVFLFAFEKLNGIGGKNPPEQFADLAALLRHYGPSNRQIARNVSVWLKGFYVCNKWETGFAELVREQGLESDYPTLFFEDAGENALLLYDGLGNYKITASHFYSEQTRPLLSACFALVLERVKALFAAKKVNFTDTLLGPPEPSYYWYPFQNALYLPPQTFETRNVSLCENEVYRCEATRLICVRSPSGSTLGARIAGYLLKRMEARVRENVKFKYKLSPEIAPVVASIPDKLRGQKALKTLLLSPSFDEAIDGAVEEYWKRHPVLPPEKPRPKPVEIRIDPAKLGQIRLEADEIQSKLLVPEENAPPPEIPPEFPPAAPLGEGFAGFAAALTTAEKEALALLESGANVSARLLTLAKQSGNVLVNVLLEQINEKALDCLGDNLIETADNPPWIYEDYQADIRRIIEGN